MKQHSYLIFIIISFILSLSSCDSNKKHSSPNDPLPLVEYKYQQPEQIEDGWPTAMARSL